VTRKCCGCLFLLFLVGTEVSTLKKKFLAFFQQFCFWVISVCYTLVFDTCGGVVCVCRSFILKVFVSCCRFVSLDEKLCFTLSLSNRVYKRFAHWQTRHSKCLGKPCNAPAFQGGVVILLASVVQIVDNSIHRINPALSTGQLILLC